MQHSFLQLRSVKYFFRNDNRAKKKKNKLETLLITIRQRNLMAEQVRRDGSQGYDDYGLLTWLESFMFFKGEKSE